MKRIFYGLAGEGLGHACRTQALIDHMDDFEVHLFTWGDAWDFFNKQNYPHLHKVAPLHFGRTDGKISLMKTVANFFRYQLKIRGSVKYVLEQAEKYQPDLFISDFEGIIPRAARQFGKPLLSIDNQHKFSRTIDKNLPLGLHFYAFFMGFAAEQVCPKPDFAVISTFYHSAVKKRFCKRTLLTNCFMRKDIETLERTNGDYVLVYYKVSVGPKILEMLAKTNEKVIVFGCPADKRITGFEYHDSGKDFIKYLAGCKAVFCASGNQLLGEAVYMGKPIFTVPEPNQPEQRINAYYVAQMNCGFTTALEDLSPEMVRDFLLVLGSYTHKDNTNGTIAAIDCIKKFACS